MRISDLKVCRSNAGFYVGREYLEDDMKGDPNFGGMPYERCSDYYIEKTAAQNFLDYLIKQGE